MPSQAPPAGATACWRPPISYCRKRFSSGLKTRRLCGPVYHFEEVASTNDLAKELAARGAPEGTLIVAEAQSRGRGRLGRQWNSPPGTGLYVSLLLRPPLPPTEMPQITLTTAVAAARALKRVTGVAPGIKWPNDLLLAGKKLGGILTEMETESEQIRHLVVGLGLNVDTRAFPEELAATATSLALGLGRPLPINSGWRSLRPGWRSLRISTNAFWLGIFPGFSRNGAA